METTEDQTKKDQKRPKDIAAHQEDQVSESEPREEILSASGVELGPEGGQVVLTPDAEDNPGGEWTGRGEGQ